MPIAAPICGRALDCSHTHDHLHVCVKEMAVQQKVYLFWGESDEDDITRLPKDWEARVADDGRIYFLK